VNSVLMMPGVRKILEVCCALQPGERVVIVTDYAMGRIAELLAAGCAAMGADPVVVFMSPREVDGAEPPASVAAAMAEAHLVLTPVSRSISHAAATRAALGRGARVLALSHFQEEMFYEGGIRADFPAVRPTCDRVADLLSEAGQAHLTSAGGTDVRMDLRGRRGNSHSCIVHEPGVFSAFPNIEANISPVEETAEGVIVIDGSIPNFRLGLLREPVRFVVKRGMIVGVAGGEQAKRLEGLLRERGNLAVYNIAQLAVGLNPECRQLTGQMTNDHGVLGTVHIGIGTSENLGGSTRAGLHFDGILRRPTLWLDGKTVLEDGRLLV
jgi:leucyl aminopeptidase (aminopeptidase T)